MRTYIHPMRAFDAVVVAGLLAVSLGCSSPVGPVNTKGVFASADIPLASYVEARTRAGAPARGRFYFPELAVYDGSGDRAYDGHSPERDALELRNLANGTQTIQDPPTKSQLLGIVEAVPAFRSREGEILGRHAKTVLAVFLEDCEACSADEDALDRAKGGLLNRGLNVLVIHVSRK